MEVMIAAKAILSSGPSDLGFDLPTQPSSDLGLSQPELPPLTFSNKGERRIKKSHDHLFSFTYGPNKRGQDKGHVLEGVGEKD